MDCLFVRVIRLRQVTQKHCRGDDVLIGPSKLWGIIPPIHDGALDMAGVTLGAAHRVMRIGRIVVR